MPSIANRTAVCIAGRAGLWLALAVSAAGQDVGGKQDSEATPTATHVADQPTWLRVTAEQVNLRSRPDANSLVVARVPRDTVLRAAGRGPYGWWRVLPPEGVFSFVSAEYVDRRGPTEGIVSVRSGTLRVRVGSLVEQVDPSQCEAHARLERGQSVRIIGEQGDWLKIVPPPGVFVYVSGDHAVPIGDDVAARLRSQVSPGTQPAAGANAAGQAVVTQPASGPDLSGPWGQRLAAVEAAIESEAAKPLSQQSWVEPIERLRPIAAQRQEPTVARLAEAWIGELQRRAAEQEAVQAAEDVLRRAARDQAQQAREMDRIERARQATTRPESVARGELLRSYALEPRDGRRWYKLRNPLTQRVEAYVEIEPESRIDPEKFLGQYVEVRGTRRPDPRLGADLVRAVEIVPLTRESPATQPTRQPP